MTAIVFLLLVGLLAYGLQRNNIPDPHLHGSVDTDDRDTARTLADLRAVTARTAATSRPANAIR